MEIQLAERAVNIQPSATLAMSARAKAMKQAGGDIISLSVGEPDFDTPLHIKEAAITAIQEGFTKYTPVDGIPELKDAIIAKFATDNQLEYTPEQILVSCGAKQSIYNVAQALLDPGDEVIIPTPYWVSYPDIVALAGAKPVHIKTTHQNNFKITAEELAAVITPKTKLLFINSPSNPSGMIYSQAELSKLAEVLLENPQVHILSDDIYEHILWPRQSFNNIPMVCPELTNRCIVINGVSKAYSMTGWRIGYAAGHESLISSMKKIQSQSTSNPCSIAQKAAVVALSGDQQCIADMVKAFKERHDFVVQSLNNIDGVHCLASQGSFYTFPDISEFMRENTTFANDIEVAEYLLTKAGVAVIPGSAFGDPNCLRLSVATSMEKLHDALKRIKTLLLG